MLAFKLGFGLAMGAVGSSRKAGGRGITFCICRLVWFQLQLPLLGQLSIMEESNAAKTARRGCEMKEVLLEICAVTVTCR